MKKRIREWTLALLIACSFFGSPKTLAWWNLLYPAAESEECGKEHKTGGRGTVKLRFFVVEWLRALK